MRQGSSFTYTVVFAGLSLLAPPLAMAQEAKTPDVIFQLPIPTILPVRIGHAEKNLSNKRLLLGCVKTTFDGRLRDFPIVFQSRS